MSRIDPELLARLMSELRVKDKAVYRRIQAIASRRRLPNNLAAIELASDLGISIQKYLRQLTPAESAKISGVLDNSPLSAQHYAPAVPLPRFRAGESLRQSVQNYVPAAPARSKAQVKIKLVSKKTKDNSVFVVHGRNKALPKSMYDFLLALGLMPLEWSKALLLARALTLRLR